jgi:hypothetical protein
VSPFFFLLPLLLAEAKGNMDLAASIRGSGTSFFHWKLCWTHGLSFLIVFSHYETLEMTLI